jgi:putative hydrolase of the HAD superfamily
VLDRLAPHVVLAVVTDGPLTSQHAKAEALQLSRWADVIVFTETLGPRRGKRHPAAFEQLEHEVGLPGDPVRLCRRQPGQGLRHPPSAGVAEVRVRRLGSLHANAPSGGDIDAEITSLDNLDTALAWDDSPTSNHIV